MTQETKSKPTKSCLNKRLEQILLNINKGESIGKNQNKRFHTECDFHSTFYGNYVLLVQLGVSDFAMLGIISCHLGLPCCLNW